MHGSLEEGDEIALLNANGWPLIPVAPSKGESGWDVAAVEPARVQRLSPGTSNEVLITVPEKALLVVKIHTLSDHVGFQSPSAGGLLLCTTRSAARRLCFATSRLGHNALFRLDPPLPPSSPAGQMCADASPASPGGSSSTSTEVSWMDSPLARQPPRTPASALRARPATTPPTRPDPGVAPGGDEGSSSGRSWDDRALEYGAPSVTPMGGRGGAWPSRVPVVAGAVAVFASELRPGHASGFMERVYVAVMRKVPVREGGDVTGQSSPPPRTPPQPGRTHSPAKTAVFSGRGPRRPSTPRPHQGLPPRTPRSAGASPTPKEDLARDLGQLAQVIEARLGESPAHGTPAPHSPVPHTLAPQTPVPEPARAGGSPLAHPSPLSPLVAGTTLSGSPGASARSAMSPEHRRALEQVRRLGDTLARVSLMAHERDVLRRCLRGWLTLSQGAPGGVRGAWAFPEEVRARLVFWVKAKASRVARRALWAWRESLGAEEGSRGEEGDGEGVEMGEGHRGEDLEGRTGDVLAWRLAGWVERRADRVSRNALREWRRVAVEGSLKRAALAEALQASVSREIGLGEVFRAWRDQSDTRALHGKLLARAVHRMAYLRMSSALAAWRSQAAFSAIRASRMLTWVRGTELRHLRRAFSAWNEAKRHGVAVRRAAEAAGAAMARRRTRDVLSGALSWWFEYARSKRARRAVGEKIEKRVASLRLGRAFSAWISEAQKTAAEEERGVAAGHLLARELARASRARLSAAFGAWRERVERKQTLEHIRQSFVDRWDRRRAHSVLQAWRGQALAVRAATHRLTSLLESKAARAQASAFAAWRAHCSTAASARVALSATLRRVAAECGTPLHAGGGGGGGGVGAAVLWEWRGAVEEERAGREAAGARAARVIGRQRAARVLAAWRGETAASGLARAKAGEMASRRQHAAVSECLEAWAATTSTLRRARELAGAKSGARDAAVLRACLAGWGDTVSSTVAGREGAREAARGFFVARNRRTAAAVLGAWGAAVEEGREREEAAGRMASARERRTARSVVAAWGGLAAEMRARRDEAEQMGLRAYVRGLTLALSAWRGVAQAAAEARRIREAGAEALRAARQRWLVRGCFAAWREASTGPMEAEEEVLAAMETALAARLRRAKMRRCLWGWGDVAWEERERRTLVSGLVKRRNARLVSEALRAWLSLCRRNATLERREAALTARREREALGRCLGAWSAVAAGLRGRREEAEERGREKDAEVLRRALAGWRYGAGGSAAACAMADAIAVRTEERLLRRALEAWRSRAEKKKRAQLIDTRLRAVARRWNAKAAQRSLGAWRAHTATIAESRRAAVARFVARVRRIRLGGCLSAWRGAVLASASRRTAETQVGRPILVRALLGWRAVAARGAAYGDLDSDSEALSRPSPPPHAAPQSPARTPLPAVTSSPAPRTGPLSALFSTLGDESGASEPDAGPPLQAVICTPRATPRREGDGDGPSARQGAIDCAALPGDASSGAGGDFTGGDGTGGSTLSGDAEGRISQDHGSRWSSSRAAGAPGDRTGEGVSRSPRGAWGASESAVSVRGVAPPSDTSRISAPGDPGVSSVLDALCGLVVDALRGGGKEGGSSGDGGGGLREAVAPEGGTETRTERLGGGGDGTRAPPEMAHVSDASVADRSAERGEEGEKRAPVMPTLAIGGVEAEEWRRRVGGEEETRGGDECRRGEGQGAGGVGGRTEEKRGKGEAVWDGPGGSTAEESTEESGSEREVWVVGVGQSQADVVYGRQYGDEDHGGRVGRQSKGGKVRDAKGRDWGGRGAADGGAGMEDGWETVGAGHAWGVGNGHMGGDGWGAAGRGVGGSIPARWGPECPNAKGGVGGAEWREAEARRSSRRGFHSKEAADTLSNIYRVLGLDG